MVDGDCNRMIWQFMDRGHYGGGGFEDCGGERETELLLENELISYH